MLFEMAIGISKNTSPPLRSLWCLSQDSLDQHRGAYDKARWVLIKALEGKNLGGQQDEILDTPCIRVNVCKSAIHGVSGYDWDYGHIEETKMDACGCDQLEFLTSICHNYLPKPPFTRASRTL